MGTDARTHSWRPADTSEKAWTLVVDRWRTMAPAEKAGLANSMSIDCERLARAGILNVEPEADESRICALLVKRRYGIDLFLGDDYNKTLE